MDKEDMVHTHSGILFNHKRNNIESVIVMWMNLEPQSELSQEEKNKCGVVMHIYGVQKDGPEEPICRV